MDMDTRRRLLVVLLVVLGILAAVVAVLYFVEPTHSLPSFLPGHAATGNGHHNKHGIAAAVIAVALWVAAWMLGGKRS
jgi:hypothetical protein